MKVALLVRCCAVYALFYGVGVGTVLMCGVGAVCVWRYSPNIPLLLFGKVLSASTQSAISTRQGFRSQHRRCIWLWTRHQYAPLATKRPYNSQVLHRYDFLKYTIQNNKVLA